MKEGANLESSPLSAKDVWWTDSFETIETTRGQKKSFVDSVTNSTRVKGAGCIKNTSALS